MLKLPTPVTNSDMKPSHFYLRIDQYAWLNERRFRTGHSFSESIRAAVDRLMKEEARKRKK